ncbi:hypothetical protein ACFQ2B_25590 [Streptomyces stramineus]
MRPSSPTPGSGVPPELLAARAAAVRRARSRLARDMARRGLPPEVTAPAAAYAGALARWLGGLPGDGELPSRHRRLSFTEDVTGVPVDLLRPRRPVPPPAPSTGDGTGAPAGVSEGGRE